ncbi:MAG: protein of unknown function ElaB [Verrucomicrobia bacterium]|nr:protein of unknown function ElaB [Verrucomicrobiota bacterium]
MKHADKHESPEDIAEHIKSLMAEAEAMLAGPAGSHTSDKLADIKARLSSAQERVTELYGVAKKKVVAGAKFTDDTIRSHPYESLAIALGVGVLIGALIRRSNNH